MAIHVTALFLVYGAIAGARLAGYGVAVTRGSVDPAIPSGSVVVGRWVQPDAVRAGQRVIFEERRGARVDPPRLRRIVDVRSESGRLIATTQDGAQGKRLFLLTNPVVEPVFSLRFLGYALSLLLTPVGWLVCIAIPASCLAFVALWHVWRPEETPAPLTRPAPVYAPPRA